MNMQSTCVLHNDMHVSFRNNLSVVYDLRIRRISRTSRIGRISRTSRIGRTSRISRISVATMERATVEGGLHIDGGKETRCVTLPLASSAAVALSFAGTQGQGAGGCLCISTCAWTRCKIAASKLLMRCAQFFLLVHNQTLCNK